MPCLEKIMVYLLYISRNLHFDAPSMCESRFASTNIDYLGSKKDVTLMQQGRIPFIIFEYF